MKKTLIALAVVAAITASIPAVMAQPGYGPGMRGGPNVEYMARVLDLTPEQQAKMKALFGEQAQRRAQMRTAMQAEMQSILTKEQYNKMIELRQLRMQNRGGAMGPGAGGRGPGYGPGNCIGTGPGPRNTQ